MTATANFGSSPYAGPPLRTVRTGTATRAVWLINEPCSRIAVDDYLYGYRADEPCRIVEDLHYDAWPTGFLWCVTHARYCGRIEHAGGGSKEPPTGEPT